MINEFKDKKMWIIYTKSNCIYCDKIKKLLETEQIVKIINCDNLLKITVKKEKFINEIKKIVGYEYKMFPIVFYDNKFIGGYEETRILFENNKNYDFLIEEDF